MKKLSHVLTAAALATGIASAAGPRTVTCGAHFVPAETEAVALVSDSAHTTQDRQSVTRGPQGAVRTTLTVESGWAGDRSASAAIAMASGKDLKVRAVRSAGFEGWELSCGADVRRIAAPLRDHGAHRIAFAWSAGEARLSVDGSACRFATHPVSTGSLRLEAAGQCATFEVGAKN